MHILSQNIHEVLPLGSIHLLIPTLNYVNKCQCGNCKVELLCNSIECSCCKEIEGWGAPLQDERALDEVGDALSCITLHPGFKIVCLEPWALRQLAGKFRTKQNKLYRRKDGENA